MTFLEAARTGVSVDELLTELFGIRARNTGMHAAKIATTRDKAAPVQPQQSKSIGSTARQSKTHARLIPKKK